MYNPSVSLFIFTKEATSVLRDDTTRGNAMKSLVSINASVPVTFYGN